MPDPSQVTPHVTPPTDPVEGVDYYTRPDGKRVYLPAFHQKRGHCCGNKCRNCPFDWCSVASDKIQASEPRPPREWNPPT